MDAAQLFSRNEELDDVPTSHLPFLMCPYYLGELALRFVDGRRRERCLEAQARLEAFLEECARLGVLSREEARSLRGEKQPASAAERRSEMIARLKRDREARARIEELQAAQRARLQRRPGAADEAQAQVLPEEAEDESTTRELLLLRLQIACRAAARQIELTLQELPLLEFAAQRAAATSPPAPAAPAAPASALTSPSAPPSSAALSALQAQEAARVAARESRLREVFRPGWTQPLYSVEEALELDLAKGLMAPSDPPPSKSRDADWGREDEDDEEELRRQRRWDDWKDDHPRGSGNRLNKG